MPCPLCKSEAYETLINDSNGSATISVRCADCRAIYEIERPIEFDSEGLKFRRLIRGFLSGVNDVLKEFSQTTHGSIAARGPVDLQSVLDEMVEAYDKPDSYNISELSQHIEAFLKSEKE